MKLDFNMNACERLEQEIKNAKPFDKALGNYLLENLKKDKVLENCYYDKKMTLQGLGQYIVKRAKNYLKGQNGAIEDKVVFGWVLHYVQDEKENETNNENEVVYQEPVVMKPQVQKETVKKVRKKKEPKDNGQLNLFDFCEGN